MTRNHRLNDWEAPQRRNYFWCKHRFGGTPVSDATMTTHYNAVEILLKHGARHYVKDNDGISQNEITTTCDSTGALVGVILEYKSGIGFQ